MYLVVVIAFITANALPEMAPLVAGGVGSVIAALVAYLAGSVAIGSLRSAVSLRAADGGPLRTAMARHGMLVMLTNVWLIAGLAGLVVFGYGRWVMFDLGLRNVPLVGRLVLIAPFLVSLVLTWLLEYRFYRMAKTRIVLQQRLMGVDARGPWSLGEFVGYNLRHQVLFVVVPISLIMLISDSLALAPIPEWLRLGGQLAAALGVILLAPVMIVRIFRTVPMPAGQLRDDLNRVCQAMRLRYRGLLIWQTGEMIANAMVMGVLWPVRYVLLSDALIRQLDPREVRAVFAHEAGHIRGHHLFYAMLFSVSGIVICSLAGEAVGRVLGLEIWVEEVIVLAMLAAAWGLGFGWISRRFERQSDVVAAWYCGDAGPSPDGRISPEGAYAFARSLERIAVLNGMSQGQFNWRHGSIRSRVQHIMWLGSTAGTRGDIDRTVRRIKLGLWLAFGLSAGTVAVRLGLGI